MLLDKAIEETLKFCQKLGIHLETVLDEKKTFKNIETFNQFADILLSRDEWRKGFNVHDNTVVDQYNAGATSTENYFDDLMKFTRSMKEEDERHVREGLTEDELELYDLLKKDRLTQAEEQKVKLAAKNLIIRLLQRHPKVLVQDWWKDSQTQLIVKNAIEEVLDQDLPDSYDRLIFKEKCDNVFELVFDFAANGRKWAA